MRVLSRGGGTVDSGTNNIEYYNVDGEKLTLFGENVLLLLWSFSLFKYGYKPVGESIEKRISGGFRYYMELTETASSVYLWAVSFSKVNINDTEINTLKDLIIKAEMDINLFDSVFTPITKEEFYDLNNI